MQADSGAIDTARQLNGSGPEILIGMSSPRAVKIESLSAAYRLESLIQPEARCSGIRVGKIPIITMCAPPAPALISASFRLARTSPSRSRVVCPGSAWGGTLNSML